MRIFGRFAFDRRPIESDTTYSTVRFSLQHSCSAFPFYLYANPELLCLLLEPVFEYQEAGLYRFIGDWAIHDTSLWYPNAVGYDNETKHLDEKMPVEEYGNMIIMAHAYYKFTNNTAHLTSHYTILEQ
jgi:hypothetical protein